MLVFFLGPTKDMVDDFWQMIFQENISLIVMLTNVIEKGAVGSTIVSNVR